MDADEDAHGRDGKMPPLGCTSELSLASVGAIPLTSRRLSTAHADAGALTPTIQPPNYTIPLFSLPPTWSAPPRLLQGQARASTGCAWGTWVAIAGENKRAERIPRPCLVPGRTISDCILASDGVQRRSASQLAALRATSQDAINPVRRAP